jgi:hypothetical protein
VHGLAHHVVAAEEKLMLLTPPLVRAPGRFCLIQRTASMKSSA